MIKMLDYICIKRFWYLDQDQNTLFIKPGSKVKISENRNSLILDSDFQISITKDELNDHFTSYENIN